MSTEKTISDLAKAETATNGQGPEAGGAAGKYLHHHSYVHQYIIVTFRLML